MMTRRVGEFAGAVGGAATARSRDYQQADLVVDAPKVRSMLRLLRQAVLEHAPTGPNAERLIAYVEAAEAEADKAMPDPGNLYRAMSSVARTADSIRPVVKIAAQIAALIPH